MTERPAQEVELRIRGKRAHVDAVYAITVIGAFDLGGPAKELGEELLTAYSIEEIIGNYKEMAESGGEGWAGDRPMVEAEIVEVDDGAQ